MSSTSPPHPLAGRFASLRRRLRMVVTARGVAWLIAALVLSVAAIGALDYRAHLPAAVRAAFLVVSLGGLGLIAYRGLWLPLRQRTDDLSLALRVEARHPELNDCLASTVQFLQTPHERGGSVAMRAAAVRDAVARVERIPFHRVVDHRGLGFASLSAAGAGALVVGALMLFPAHAWTALLRLGHPFGGAEWPARTRLVDLQARQRVARGEAFEIRGGVEGVIPEQAEVVFWFEGGTPSQQSVSIRKGGDGEAGKLHVRLDGSRVVKSFRYRVTANDAVTQWHDVAVLPPPSLVSLDGRPSPRVRLVYPIYTDLPAFDLPDGAGTIEAVAGTRVVIRAAADRPLARAWIELRPESSVLPIAAGLAPLGGAHLLDGLGFLNGSRAVWGRVPAVLHADERGQANRVLSVAFVPYISGTYALCLEDEAGIAGGRLFDCRTFADPAPTVSLARPSPSLDVLSVLPGADIPLQVLVEDPQYAVRSVALEVRCGINEATQRRILYDHRLTAEVIDGLTAVPMPRPRLPLVRVNQRFSLSSIKHADGKPLREGDVVTLAVSADDFDDVTLDKKPGRSHEVEIRIIGPAALEALLNQAQAQVRQELLRLREQERAARQKVAAVEKQWRNVGQLKREDLDHLAQAEQLQEQVRGRVGDERQGLRAEARRIVQAMKDNHLPRSGAQERMETVQAELDRLARAELEPIEPLLANARKENELAAAPKKPEKGERGALGQALDHQGEVEKTLSDLLARLEPWSTTREVHGEARALLEEERKLAARTEQLARELPAGRDPEGLTPEQRAELEKDAERQERLAEHARQLLDKMDRVAQEKKRAAAEKLQLAAKAERREAERLREEAESLQQEANALEQAARRGRASDVVGQMRQAGQDVGKNRLGKAGKEQQAALQNLEKLARSLEDRRADELDQLIAKMREAEKQLNELADEQDRLKKKVKEAQALADPAKREAELRRLSRAQERLRQEAQEMARTLTRLRADRAREALSRAGAPMEDAGKQLQRGEDPEEANEEALDRLDEARAELQKARADAEEELAREKQTKMADLIRRLKERQEALLPHLERVHREVLQRKEWDRALLLSLAGYADAQEALAKETGSLAEGKLKVALVFARSLTKAQESMERAATAMRQRVEKGKETLANGLDAAAEEAADKVTQGHMRDAALRLQQLLDALEPEKGAAQRPTAGGAGGGVKAANEGIPYLAQLKVLKHLQEYVLRRTEEFDRKHPDRTKLTPKAAKELDALRQDQTDLAELLQHLTAADQGGKP